MEFYKLILFVIQVYCIVLYCIYCERNLCSVLSTRHILFLLYWPRNCFSLQSLFLWSVCHTHAVVLSYRIKYQIHTVKRKHCCVTFESISVFQVKFPNLHPLFSMIWYLPSEVLLPYTQNLATTDVFLLIVQAFSSVVVFDAIKIM